MPLMPAETSVTTERGVRLYDGDEHTDFDSGDLTLTSHRLLWVEAAPSQRAICVHLSLVRGVELYKGFAFASSPKVVVTVAALDKPFSGVIAKSKHNVFKLSFRQGSASTADAFRGHMQKAVTGAAWTSDPAPSVSSLTQATMADGKTTTLVGLAAIQKRRMDEMEHAERTIENAFAGDLKSLQERAKEMVVLAEKFTTKLAQRQGAANDEEASQLQTCLLNLGIDNPVTRSACKTVASFHRELSRELGDFLKKPLQDSKGIMTLVDVYCLFVRARGSGAACYYDAPTC